MYSYYNNPVYYRDDNRGLLLPFLVGAAVAFPIGYIASNTNTNKSQMMTMNYGYGYSYPMHNPYMYPYPIPYY